MIRDATSMSVGVRPPESSSADTGMTSDHARACRPSRDIQAGIMNENVICAFSGSVNMPLNIE